MYACIKHWNLLCSLFFWSRAPHSRDIYVQSRGVGWKLPKFLSKTRVLSLLLLFRFLLKIRSYSLAAKQTMNTPTVTSLVTFACWLECVSIFIFESFCLCSWPRCLVIQRDVGRGLEKGLFMETSGLKGLKWTRHKRAGQDEEDAEREGYPYLAGGHWGSTKARDN